MNRERLLDAATAIVAGCAILVTALYVRRELGFATTSASTASRRTEPAWRDYALGGHSIGRADAAVTIVEFGDYQCPSCRRLDQILDSLGVLKSGVARLIYRHFPLSIHPVAMEAARASECAAQQGQFAEMHRALFANQDSLRSRNWEWLAKDAGILRVDLFLRCIKARAKIQSLEADRVAATKLGVTGTPTLLINEMLITGTPAASALSRLIADARRQQRASRP